MLCPRYDAFGVFFRRQEIFARYHGLTRLLLQFAAGPFGNAAVLAGAVERAGRIAHILDALVPHLRQPKLDRLRLWTGDRLDDSQKCLGISHVGQT